MEFIPMVLLLATAKKLVDLVTQVRDGQFRAAATQLGAYVAGVVTTFLFAATDFANGVDVGVGTLGSVNAATLVVVGVAVASAASVTHDTITAIGTNKEV